LAATRVKRQVRWNDRFDIPRPLPVCLGVQDSVKIVEKPCYCKHSVPIQQVLAEPCYAGGV
jgi:hypothetical protein